jgi:hypothetical protein
LTTSDSSFAKLRLALDARMKQLTATGVGIVRKQAEPLTEDHELILWDKGLFTTETSEGFLYLMFFYNCKLFGLRGGDEHRSLEREQFIVGEDETGKYLNFIGRSAKNLQGGLKQRSVTSKNLKIYAKIEQGCRCIVNVYSLYFDLIPEVGPFYRKPLKGPVPKFGVQVIGRNRLSELMKEICGKAGFVGNFTNHSGKVTCATRLFQNNVDEQLIMRQTGHRSNAVRMYKRPGVEHDLQVSNLLQAPSPKKLRNENDDNKENLDSNSDACKDVTQAVDKAGNNTIAMTFNFSFNK